MRGCGTRREFLEASSAAGLVLFGAPAALGSADLPAPGSEVRVVVWDEQQPAQKEAYEKFLGNAIAEHLKTLPNFAVKSVNLDAPQQGLSDSLLDSCDVLIWWGHVRHAEITPETGRKIVARVKEGRLSLIALHSAHWSTPFMEAMNERTRLDVERTYRSGDRSVAEVRFVPPPRRYTLPAADARLTPYVVEHKYPDGALKLDVHLPYCCFPAYRTDGKPSTVRVLKPRHPIARDVPSRFEVPQTEMYAEPFHVPQPDEVVFEECWATGEWFRSGAIWTIGKGRVFYFRPGHETYPIYKQPVPLKILANAVGWLAAQTSAQR